MTKSYSQVLKQIEALKADAEKLRQKEVDGVIARIREAIGQYGLTAADLGLGARAAKAPKAVKPGRKKAKAAAAVKAIKFRNEAGQTWVGRGKRPQWLRDALAAGKTLQDFQAS